MKNIIFLLLALFLTSDIVTAQARRNAAEASQNQKAMAANEAQLERDLGELESFKTKLAQFETAFTNKDVAKVATLKTDLLTDMQREISQSEKKIAQSASKKKERRFRSA